MPEYLAPGVYVEETSFRAKSIEGVGTSTTGFVGATRYGPTEGEPELITSFGQFERIYGGLDPLNYEGTEVTTYLSHAVRAFFDNGGARLYVSRTYEPPIAVPELLPNETPAQQQARVGRAIAPIPVPVPQIEQVNQAAIAATNVVLTAIGAAITTLQQTQAAALSILEFAVPQLLRTVTPVPVPPLTYDGTIVAQINTFITGLPNDDVRKAALQAAFADPWRSVIEPAGTALQTIATQLGSAATAQTAVSEAYATGTNAGNSAGLPSAPDLPRLTAAGTNATNAATATQTAVAGLTAPATTLTTAVDNITNATTALTAATALSPLITAAQVVITAATNDADGLITTAAQLVTLESRLSRANAQADWLARFPGVAGNITIEVTGRLGANVLLESRDGPSVSQIRNGDLVVIQRGSVAPIYSAIRSSGSWSFQPASGSDLPLSSLNPAIDRVIPLTLTVQMQLPGKFAQPQVWDGLTISALPNRLRDSATQVFAAEIANRLQALETPVVLRSRSTIRAAQLAANLVDLADWSSALARGTLVQTCRYMLEGGSDGREVEPSRYEGLENASTSIKSGLKSLEDLEEIAIVAAPGYSYDWGRRRSDILTISQYLIAHCDRMRYRVAVLDSPNNLSLSQVREYRALLDTTRAAVYYPWVRVNDPISERDTDFPPSGFMAGIYARNDVEIGVHKAPANEVVRGAIGLELLINKAQQDILNPLGINCIRFFEGRGIRAWGARTVSSDPEWKYLNIRRYFAYLEASIDRSTQWAVFEPNGQRLWANVRRTVESFLETEWRNGRLAGSKLEEAFFAKCDRSTMTQNDLDNGRMICLVGVSPLYPAEFVIFRIGQWTADRR